DLRSVAGARSGDRAPTAFVPAAPLVTDSFNTDARRRRPMSTSRALAALAALLCLLSAAPAEPPADAAGDPLPAGALARVGTTRFRHGGPVESVAFTPDGKAVLSGSYDRTARLWSVETAGPVGRLDSSGRATGKE